MTGYTTQQLNGQTKVSMRSYSSLLRAFQIESSIWRALCLLSLFVPAAFTIYTMVWVNGTGETVGRIIKVIKTQRILGPAELSVEVLYPIAPEINWKQYTFVSVIPSGSPLQAGDEVRVRYRSSNRSDARIAEPFYLWRTASLVSAADCALFLFGLRGLYFCCKQFYEDRREFE